MNDKLDILKETGAFLEGHFLLSSGRHSNAYCQMAKLQQYPDKAAQVLELRETAPGVWEWVPARRTWASITLQPKTNLFSKVGIGARNAAVIVRRQPSAGVIPTCF